MPLPFMLPAIASGIGSAVGGLFGDDPSQAFAEQMRHGMAEAQARTREANQLLQPYSQAGQAQLPFLQQYIGETADPGAFYKNIMSGYQESPMAQEQQRVGQQAGLHGASASGLLGSSPLMEGLQRSSQAISSQDMERYFRDLMGIRQGGVGASQGLYGQGLGAAGQQSAQMAHLSIPMMQAYGGLGQAAQLGAQGQRNLFGDIGGAIGGLAGAYNPLQQFMGSNFSFPQNNQLINQAGGV